VCRESGLQGPGVRVKIALHSLRDVPIGARKTWVWLEDHGPSNPSALSCELRPGWSPRHLKVLLGSSVDPGRSGTWLCPVPTGLLSHSRLHGVLVASGINLTGPASMGAGEGLTSPWVQPLHLPAALPVCSQGQATELTSESDVCP
jgi:hypothetical protein